MTIPEIIKIVLGGGASIGAVGLLAAGLIPTRWTNGAMRYSLAIAAVPVAAVSRLMLHASDGYDVVYGVSAIVVIGSLLSTLIEYQKSEGVMGRVRKGTEPRS